MSHCSDGQLIAGLVLVGLLAVIGGQARFVRISRALGLEQLLASSFLFLPVGMLLSEGGLGVLTPAVTRDLDAIVTLALAVLGLLLGLRLDTRRRAEGYFARVLALESLVTLCLVACPCVVLLEVLGSSGPGEQLEAAALLGAAAAISGARPFQAAALRVSWRAGAVVSRLADASTVAGVLAAGVLVAVLSHSGGLSAGERLLALGAIGTVGGLSAWLFAREVHERGLRLVLLLGVLFVTAGTAAHLALPPIAATLLAGLVLAHLPGNAAKELADTLQFLEGPAKVVLLVVGGASLQLPPWPVLLVVPVFVGLRAAGKVLGGALASRLSGGILPENVGLGLLPSSAIALGLALDYQASSQSPFAGAVVFVAVVGSLLSETAGVWTTRLLAKNLAPRSLLPAPEAEVRS